jgi:hypothetical protein
MAICTKCNIDKEVDQYSTYFHSTQNKLRTRRICKSCFNEQKSIYRESIKNKKIIQPTPVSVSFTPIPTPSIIPTPIPEHKKDGRGRKRLVEDSVFIGMDVKQCAKCKEILPLSEYYAARAGRYAGKPTARCKVCHNENKKKEYRQKVEDNGGGLVVPMYPNTYSDKHQRVNTFLLMEAMGWVFNDNGVWSKEGIKDKDKVWEFRLRPDYVKYTGKNRPKEYPKIKHKSYARIEEMNDLLEQGYPLYYICKEFGVARQTLRKMLQEYGKEKN